MGWQGHAPSADKSPAELGEERRQALSVTIGRSDEADGDRRDGQARGRAGEARRRDGAAGKPALFDDEAHSLSPPSDKGGSPFLGRPFQLDGQGASTLSIATSSRDAEALFGDDAHRLSPPSEKAPDEEPFLGPSQLDETQGGCRPFPVPARVPVKADKALFDGIHENAASVHSALNQPKQLEQCLQANSAAANQLDPDGDRRPLHWAAARGNTKCVELLLHAGADLRAVDATGQTAVQLARPHLEVVALLSAWANRRGVRKAGRS